MSKESLIASNKKAYHEYFIEEDLEVGIVLTGTEIKSIRSGKASLKESYIRIRNGELFLYGMHIAPYEQGNRYNVDAIRERKLLAHKKQIRSFSHKVDTDGMTIVPLKIYLDERGRAKLKIALAKGKKLYDKRASIKERDEKRKIGQIIKNKGRNYTER
jgi:SsrA-binding protein